VKKSGKKGKRSESPPGRKLWGHIEQKKVCRPGGKIPRGGELRRTGGHAQSFDDMPDLVIVPGKEQKRKEKKEKRSLAFQMEEGEAAGSRGKHPNAGPARGWAQKKKNWTKVLKGKGR